MKKPQKIPKEINPSTIWRWFHQWQVWQARRNDTNKNTLFCGLCGFVSPSEKTILKRFLAKHGNKKYYNCLNCEKRFCLLTNCVEHMEVVHSVIKDSGRFDWGPIEQQTELLEYMLYYEHGYDSDSPDSNSDVEKESDHEYYEERTGNLDPESDPDSEGAHEGAEESDEEEEKNDEDPEDDDE